MVESKADLHDGRRIAIRKFKVGGKRDEEVVVPYKIEDLFI